MILTLLRHEKVLRTMRWLPIGLGMGAFLVVLRRTPPPGLPFFPSDFQPQYLLFPALFFWAILGPYLLGHGATSRCNRYQMALPLPTGKLWLSHVSALILSALLILGIASVVVMLGNHLQSLTLMDKELRSLMVNVAAFIILAVMLVQSLLPGLYEIPLDGIAITYLVAVWVGLLLLIPILSVLPLYWALVPAALGLLVGLRIYRSLPPAFTMVPRSPGPLSLKHTAAMSPTSSEHASVAGSAGIVAGGPQASRWRVHTTLFRTLYNPIITPVVCGILVFFGFRNSGYHTSGISNLVWIFWVWICLSTLIVISSTKLHLLDPLPISRRAVFGYLILPGLLVVFIGYGLGTVTGKGMALERSLVEYEERYYDPQLDVRVPLEFWEVSRDGNPRPLEPCCDEPHGAWSVSLVRDTDMVLYNPYHAPADSSPEFVARQFGRAVEAVYGRHIPILELRDRYFATGDEGGTALAAGRFDLLDDYPGLRPVGWARSLAAIVAVIGIVWLLYLAMVMRLGHRYVTIGHLALTMIGVAFLFMLIWTSNQGITKEWKLSAFAGILARKLTGVLPGSTLGLWVLALVSVIGCFLLARAQFTRMEIPVNQEHK